jgi:hypothetical protein
MTAVESYIVAIKNYKNIGGSIDDAIVIAETLLKEVVEREKHISDEEIEKEAHKISNDIDKHISFVEGAKWYREQLKERQ